MYGKGLFRGATIAGVALAGLMLALCACQHNPAPLPPSAAACTPPGNTRLDEALSKSKDDLRLQECQLHFDAYFDNLLEIAAGEPGLENKRKFSDFLLWCNSQGILTLAQARNRYSRYFSSTFVSLPDDYNICSFCRDRQELLANLAQELRQKDLGVLKACGDKKTYYQAAEQYSDTLLLLDATCIACSEDPAGRSWR